MKNEKFCHESYDTDKFESGYIEKYDLEIGHLTSKKINLLEVGIKRGGSLEFWRNYFPQGIISGIDIRVPTGLQLSEGINAYEGDQADTGFLTKIANRIAPDGFDIIIDDASHLGKVSRITFNHLFYNHLKPGGIYVIEDWGTGYWSDWPDGKDYNKKIPLGFFRSRNRIISHDYGMVGFIKQLIDCLGKYDINKKNRNSNKNEKSEIEFMKVYPSISFIKKVI